MSPPIPLIDESTFEQYATDYSGRILASLNLKTGPVPLRPLVDLCSIQRVVFGWLPVAGGLSVDEKGFSIHVQADKKDARNWASFFNCQTDEARHLPPRVRFTIAHEIAHTFFFRWSGEKPVSLVDNPKQQLLPSLETACNRAAGALLLPQALLRPIVQDRSWTLSLFCSVASFFNVSPHVLLLRLQHLEKLSSDLISPHTLVAMIREEQKKPTIAARVAGRSVQKYLSSSPSRWLELLQLSGSRFYEPYSSWTVELPTPSGLSGASVTLCDVRLKTLYKSRTEDSFEQPRTALLTANISPNSQFVLPFR